MSNDDQFYENDDDQHDDEGQQDQAWQQYLPQQSPVNIPAQPPQNQSQQGMAAAENQP